MQGFSLDLHSFYVCICLFLGHLGAAQQAEKNMLTYYFLTKVEVGGTLPITHLADTQKHQHSFKVVFLSTRQI